MKPEDEHDRLARNPSRGPKPISPGSRDPESTFQPSPIPQRSSGRRRSRDPRADRAAARTPGNGRDPDRGSDRPTNAFERLIYGKVGSNLLARFFRQLAGYLEAGVDLLKALDSLEAQFKGTAMAPVIARVVRSIRGGDGLSEAIEREPKAFDRLVRSMIRVAEARGAVPETLRELAEHLENRVRLLRKARTAMIYPTAVILIACLVAWLLTVFVLPPLVGILEEMTRGKGVTLPLPTRLLMGMSHFMSAHGWWAIPSGAFLGILGLMRLYRLPAGRALMDGAAIRLPVLGKLFRKVETARFARTLSGLLGTGLDFDSSLRLTADVLHATPYRRAVVRLREGLMEGMDLSEGVDAVGIFEVDVSRVVASGEASGKLPEALEHLAEDYEEQVERMVENLGQLLQPLLTLLIGGFVFFIALAFVLAYITLIGNLASGL